MLKQEASSTVTHVKVTLNVEQAALLSQQENCVKDTTVVLTSGHVADLSSSYVSTSCEEPSKLRDEEDHTGQQQMCVKTHMQELFSLSAYNQSRVTGISEIYFTNPDIIKVKAKPVALLVSL